MKAFLGVFVTTIITVGMVALPVIHERRSLSKTQGGIGMPTLRQQIQAALLANINLRLVCVEEGDIEAVYNAETLTYATRFNPDCDMYICKLISGVKDLHKLQVIPSTVERFFEDFYTDDSMLKEDSFVLWLSVNNHTFNKSLFECVTQMNSDPYRNNEHVQLLKIVEKICDYE